MSFFRNIVGADESLVNVGSYHDVYPTIDPTEAFQKKTYKGKVVIVTGASGGIGASIALFYAKAGAGVTIVSRKQSTLDESKARILKEAPDARVLAFAADVKDWRASEQAVKATISEFGRLDILVANAGVMTSWSQSIAEKDPDEWWNTWEVNVRGVFNFVRAAAPELQKTQGYVVVIGAGLAQLRYPGISDYGISKFAINRFVEYIAVEFPNIKSFSLHPGVIFTNMVESSRADAPAKKGSFEQPDVVNSGIVLDTAELPAATSLYLTAGKADWLNGRYVSANWDLALVEKNWKAKILEQNGLVGKLYIPK